MPLLLARALIYLRPSSFASAAFIPEYIMRYRLILPTLLLLGLSACAADAPGPQAGNWNNANYGVWHGSEYIGP